MYLYVSHLKKTTKKQNTQMHPEKNNQGWVVV